MGQIIRPTEVFLDTYTRQTQWIERRGLLLLGAMFLGGIGAATFLLSLFFFKITLGLMVGFGLGFAGKGLFHLIFLGQPLRFWKGILKPQNSWISRGLIALGLFGILGPLYILLYLSTSNPEALWIVQSLKVILIVLLSFLLLYDGFLLADAKGISFWNASFMPILFPVFSLLGGKAVMSFLHAFIPGVDILNRDLFELIERILLVFGAVILSTYLLTMYNSVAGAKQSVLELIKGKVVLPFLGGAVLLGIMLPIITVIVSIYIDIPTLALGTIALLAVIGDYFLKFSVLKAGIYSPLYPVWIMPR